MLLSTWLNDTEAMILEDDGTEVLFLPACCCIPQISLTYVTQLRALGSEGYHMFVTDNIPVNTMAR
jgi:hypothetical protein